MWLAQVYVLGLDISYQLDPSRRMVDKKRCELKMNFLGWHQTLMTCNDSRLTGVKIVTAGGNDDCHYVRVDAALEE